MKVIVFCLSAFVSLAQTASIGIASDGCRENTFTLNGVSIASLADVHGGMSYTDGLGNVTAYGQLTCTNASSKSKGTNPESLTQIWRAGTSRETTIKIEVTNPDASTVQEDIYITNNGTETITSFSINPIGYEVGTAIGGNCTDGITLRASRQSSKFYGYFTWATNVAAIWMGNLSQNAYLESACNATTFKTLALKNSFVGTINTYSDTIAPAATRHYTIYRKFFASGTSQLSAGKQAISVYGQSSTPLANNGDRRPIAVWFMAQTAYKGVNNPRGYFSSGLNALNPSTFATEINSQAANVISTMNAMAVKPQGVILWDLEGGEFAHSMTYLGYPNKLNLLAPEMHAAADSLIAQIRAAGYRVGLTIRPQFITFHDGGTRKKWTIAGATLANIPVVSGVATVTTSTAHGLSTNDIVTLRGATTLALNSGRYVITVTGANTFTFSSVAPDATYSESGIYIEYGSLPATCYYTASSIFLRDVAVLYGSYTYPSSTRTARCVGTDTWEFSDGNSGAGYQTSINDAALMTATLNEKIQYAYSRWGVDMFYIDSNVSSGGGVMDNQILVDVKTANPNVLLIPEWDIQNTFQSSAPFLDYGTLSQLLVTDETMQSNLASFGSILVGDRDPNSNLASWQKTLLQGSTFMPRAWFPDTQTTKMAVIWDSILSASKCVSLTARTFCGSPRSSFTYPLVMRVYFASSSGELPASTFYCEKTDATRCFSDGVIFGDYASPVDPSLSGMTVYQIRYYDFAGNLVSNPGNYGTIN